MYNLCYKINQRLVISIILMHRLGSWSDVVACFICREEIALCLFYLWPS